jgi:phosphoserine phosphatase
LRLERAYDWMRGKYEDDPERFAEHWTGMARRWSFADVNDLIEEHNKWYPAERRLPLSPRTGDYITIGGRDWRRKLLDSDWILEQFPPVL